MSFFSALRRKPEEEDLYEDYEESYAYEDEGQDWASEEFSPSTALQICRSSWWLPRSTRMHPRSLTFSGI